MSIDRNKAVVRRYFEEGRNQGAVEVVDEVFASRIHSPLSTRFPAGVSGRAEAPHRTVARGLPGL